MSAPRQHQTTFQCHHCRGVLEFPPHSLMKLVECYYCGHKTLLTHSTIEGNNPDRSQNPPSLYTETSASARIGTARENSIKQLTSASRDAQTSGSKDHVPSMRIDPERLIAASKRLNAARLRRIDTAGIQRIEKTIQVLGLLVLAFNVIFLIITIVPGGMETIGSLLVNFGTRP